MNVLYKYVILLLLVFMMSSSLYAQHSTKPYAKELEAVELKLREGNFQGAVEILDNILINYPDAADIYYAKALLFGQVGNLDVALVNANEAYKKEPALVYVNYIVELYKSQKKWDKVVDVLTEAKSRFPQETFLGRELLATLGFMDKFDEALLIYEGEKAKGFSTDTLDVVLADVYYKAGKFKEGVALLTPWYQKSSLAAVYGRLGFGYVEDKKLKEAISVLNYGVEKTNDPTLYLDLADAYKESGNTKQTFDALKKAFDSEQLEYIYKYRVMLDLLGPTSDSFSINQVQELANLLVLKHPRVAESHMLKGEVLWKRGELAEARSVFLTAVGIAPKQIDAWRMLINVDLADKQADLAIMHSKEALAVNPGNPLLLYFAGLSFMAKEDTEMSRKMLEAALDNSTGENNYLQSLIYGSLGDLYHKLNMNAASDVAYEEAIKLDSTNVFAMNNLAYYLSVRKQDLDKAASYSLRSNEVDPKSSTFQDTYAWILFQQGNYNEALKWIEKAIKNSDQPSSVLIEHYGDILSQLGKTKDALKQWNKALTVDGLVQKDKLKIEEKIKMKKYVE